MQLLLMIVMNDQKDIFVLRIQFIQLHVKEAITVLQDLMKRQSVHKATIAMRNLQIKRFVLKHFIVLSRQMNTLNALSITIVQKVAMKKHLVLQEP